MFGNRQHLRVVGTLCITALVAVSTAEAECEGIAGTEARAHRLKSVDLTSLEGWEVVSKDATASTRGYELEELHQFYNAERSLVLSALSSPELAGLRAYAEEQFPEPQFTTLAQGSVRGSSTMPKYRDERVDYPDQQPGRSGQPAQSTVAVSPRFAQLVPDNQVKTFVASFRDFVAKLLSACQPLDLRIASVPTKATFRMQPRAGGSERETTTDDSLRVFRGLYKYALQKVGYKAVAGSLNLVDDTGSRLSCELVPIASPDHPRPCVLD